MSLASSTRSSNHKVYFHPFPPLVSSHSPSRYCCDYTENPFLTCPHQFRLLALVFFVKCLALVSLQMLSSPWHSLSPPPPPHRLSASFTFKPLASFFRVSFVGPNIMKLFLYVFSPFSKFIGYTTQPTTTDTIPILTLCAPYVLFHLQLCLTMLPRYLIFPYLLVFLFIYLRQLTWTDSKAGWQDPPCPVDGGRLAYEHGGREGCYTWAALTRHAHMDLGPPPQCPTGIQGLATCRLALWSRQASPTLLVELLNKQLQSY